MIVCPICGKQFKRLSRHLRTSHNLINCTLEPQTLKEFIELSILIPFDTKTWDCLLKNKKVITDYLNTGVELPTDLFAIFYQAFERYRSTRGCKLVVSKPLSIE